MKTPDVDAVEVSLLCIIIHIHSSSSGALARVQGGVTATMKMEMVKKQLMQRIIACRRRVRGGAAAVQLEIRGRICMNFTGK